MKTLSQTTVITNARLYDGTGAPSRLADITVKGDRIDSIAPAGSAAIPSDASVLEAEGLALAPGFIDVHSHSDLRALSNPKAFSKISQGVTTEIVGNCGISWGLTPNQLWGKDYADFVKSINTSHPAVNVASLVGHNTLRKIAMGNENREPTSQEMQKMKDLLQYALDLGACGFSSGLFYIPGRYAKTDEMLELGALLKGTGKPYVTHMRSEGDQLLEAIQEAIAIAAAGDNQLQVSHFKASAKRNWHKLDAAIQLLNDARQKGMVIYADRYPYLYTCTTLRSRLPAPYSNIADIKAYLEDTQKAEELIQLLDRVIDPDEGWHKSLLISTGIAEHRQYVSMSVWDIAQRMGVSPARAYVTLIRDGAPYGAFGMMCQENLQKILQLDWVVAGSDASCMAQNEFSHPRAFGTFPIFYQMVQKLMSPEQAIYRMSGLSAEIFHIENRGMVKPGFFADLVLFDPEHYTCECDFKEPWKSAQGIRYVFVNGMLSYDAEEPDSTKQNGIYLGVPNKNESTQKR